MNCLIRFIYPLGKNLLRIELVSSLGFFFLYFWVFFFFGGGFDVVVSLQACFLYFLFKISVSIPTVLFIIWPLIPILGRAAQATWWDPVFRKKVIKPASGGAAFRKQTQADLCEFQTSLVCRESSRIGPPWSYHTEEQQPKKEREREWRKTKGSNKSQDSWWFIISL